MYYFPDKNYFPNYFPNLFNSFFGVQKSEQLLFSQKLLLIFLINFGTHICSTFYWKLSTLRQISTFFGIWYGIRSIFQFFPLNNFLKKILYILFIYIYIYKKRTNKKRTTPPPISKVNTSLHKFYKQYKPADTRKRVSSQVHLSRNRIDKATRLEKDTRPLC